jgi:hypothetical protein
MLANVQLVLTVTDDLRVRLVRIINGLASKTTTDVRGLMKASGLFDLRDGLLLELLNSDVRTSESMQLLQQINLEALAGSRRFRESKTIETLLSWLLDTTEKEVGVREGIVTLFQRQICKCSDNVRYIAKVVEDPVFVSVLTGKSTATSMEELEKHLKEKRAEIKTNMEKLLKIANAQQAEHIKQQARCAQERGAKRSKVFQTLAKDKAVAQNAIADYIVREGSKG